MQNTSAEFDTKHTPQSHAGQSHMGDSHVTVREAVGVFPDDEHLQAAIDELEMAQFPRHDISVLGSKGEMEDTYNKPYRDPHNIKDDARAPRGVHVMPEERSLAEAALVGGGIIVTVVVLTPVLGAAGGPMLSNILLLLALAAVGGLVGFGLAMLLRRTRANRHKKQIRKGGLLLWVGAPTREMEIKAQSILAKHGARDVHVHEIDRAAA